MPHPNPLVGLLPYVRGPMTFGQHLAEQARLRRQYERVHILLKCGVSLDTAVATVQKGEL